MSHEPLLSVEDLKTYCHTRAGIVKAVDGVSFTLERGDALGLVGESGSGKSMTCNSIVRLTPQPATRNAGGRVLFEGKDLLSLPQARMREIRGKRISMILQDPLMSLNPVFTIGNQVGEAFRLHGEGLPRRSVRQKVLDVLGQVNIPSPERRLRQYPFQFSGGMRQRTVAAMALGAAPSLLIADEPTTSLDVTVQDQFLRLLKDMQARAGMALILVTHDLGIVAETCNKIAVMYAGRIVEIGATRDVLEQPAHPYTQALLQALPKAGGRRGQRREKLFQIPGDPPNVLDLAPGCAFRPRCHRAVKTCETAVFPPMVEVGRGRTAACWRLQEEQVCA